jgi:threonine/homoserine efflux transporter RhtA
VTGITKVIVVIASTMTPPGFVVVRAVADVLWAGLVVTGIWVLVDSLETVAVLLPILVLLLPSTGPTFIVDVEDVEEEDRQAEVPTGQDMTNLVLVVIVMVVVVPPAASVLLVDCIVAIEVLSNVLVVDVGTGSADGG